MRSAFDDLTVLQHADQIGVADRRKTMRDDKGGAVLHQSFHTVFDMTLGTGIDGTGRFVQYQDRCLGDRRTSDI